jgi:hypothetical protein
MHFVIQFYARTFPSKIELDPTGKLKEADSRRIFPPVMHESDAFRLQFLTFRQMPNEVKSFGRSDFHCLKVGLSTIVTQQVKRQRLSNV